jgi:hypothetical protein
MTSIRATTSIAGPHDQPRFRGTRVRREGHIRAGGVDKDVAFVDADHSIDDQIDAAYRSKYRRYAKSITDSINSPKARSTTIKLVPQRLESS